MGVAFLDVGLELVDAVVRSRGGELSKAGLEEAEVVSDHLTREECESAACFLDRIRSDVASEGGGSSDVASAPLTLPGMVRWLQRRMGSVLRRLLFSGRNRCWTSSA